MSYIGFCEELCIPSSQKKQFSNGKPWFAPHLKQLRQDKDRALKAGDRAQFIEAKYALRKEINAAKAKYAAKLRDQFAEHNATSVWSGFKKITNYKPRAPPLTDNRLLANQLNSFYCRFESNHSPSQPSSTPTVVDSLTNDACTTTPTVSLSEVHKTLRAQNPRKAAGPNGVSAATIKNCANQLAPILTDIFSSSLSECHVPACFKESTIIPVPKKPNPTGLNDYRPVALTSVVMKCFERLILRNLKHITEPRLDPMQFAYRENRSTEDAVNMALHYILEHLEHPGCYARILFIDFSSAFNTVVPSILDNKLKDLHVPTNLRCWISNFLSGRSQRVKIGKQTSDTKKSSTGSPQGCVLSPLLFSLYTNDCVSSDESVRILKFADDTTIIGLIKNGDESAYRSAVSDLTEWCNLNNLTLNAAKTVEMIVDFRRSPTAPPHPLNIRDSPVSWVDSFRLLGTHLSRDLKWEVNTSSLMMKAQQRIFFLRQLRKFQLSQEMLVHFYRAVIESILTSGILIWFEGLSSKDRGKLQRVIKQAERITDCNLPTLDELYLSRLKKRAIKMKGDRSHPGYHIFNLLPSGRRLRTLRTRTSRRKNSFFPAAITCLNNGGLPTPPPLP